MKPLLFIAFILIISGVLIFTYHGVTYTTREKALDLGPLQVTTEQKNTVPFAPIAGSSILILGGIMLLMNYRKT